jgi:hypothetical protein
MNIFSKRIQLLTAENEVLQKEQDRLIEVQTKILNESRKRDQELQKQVQKILFIYSYMFSFYSIKSNLIKWKMII